MEEWPDVIGWEQYYEVSNLGNIRSKDRLRKHSRSGNYYVFKGRPIKVYPYENDYTQVELNAGGLKKTYYVHRLVAQAFIPNLDNKPQVNHIDGDKSNNCVTNLEWVTRSQNMRHAADIGLWNPWNSRLNG